MSSQSDTTTINNFDGSSEAAHDNVYVTVDDFDHEQVIPYGAIGEIVDVRTYRRWLPDEKRRETAIERWARVINYNLNLVANVVGYDTLRKEGLLMVNKFSQLKADASGRTKWIGGTDTAINNPASQFNCAFLAVNRIEAFSDAFNLLMLGSGVGFRVFSKDIEALPSIASVPDLHFLDYDPYPVSQRLENTDVEAGFNTYVEVGDSRQGWIDAVMVYLSAATKPTAKGSKIIYRFDSVRPAGERLKGFGGTASGHEALKTIITDIHRIIQECPYGRLRSIDCMDIMCAIAKGVVAGSSRRSAMICLFEQGDKLCAAAKKGLYTNPSFAHKSYRIQSNNTACLTAKPSLDEIKKLLQTCKTEGEPGFNNYGEMVRRRTIAAQTWRPNSPVEQYINVGTNPCHEIILSAGTNNGNSGSFCNLTTLPLTNFVVDGELDYSELQQSVKLNTRISLRQTCVDVGMDGWSETQLEERLLGVSLTGCQDAFAMLGWETGDYNIIDLLVAIRFWANEEATRYADILDVPRPLLVTTIKPEGTGSQVFGCSSGLHWDWAPYYIRRVQMSASDALAKTLIDQGFPCYPSPYDLSAHFPEGDIWEKITAFDECNDFDKRQYLDRSSAVIFEFPVKSLGDRTQAEVGAIEQLENLKVFGTVYCDHMPSATISVKDDEWDSVAEWININWDSYITASFFPYSEAKYPLLPYEAITESEYAAKLSEIPDYYKVSLPGDRIRFVVDEMLLDKHEWVMDDSSDEPTSDCVSGFCPVR